MAKMNIKPFYPMRAFVWLMVVSVPVYILFAFTMPDGILLVTLLAACMFLLMFFLERSPVTTAFVVFVFWIPLIVIQSFFPDIIAIEFKRSSYGIILVVCLACCHSSLQGFLRHMANYVSWLNAEKKY